jgi:hypothetical protein
MRERGMKKSSTNDKTYICFREIEADEKCKNKFQKNTGSQ